MYYVYIVTSKRNGTLYIGVTNDIARRAKEHKEKTVRGFTQKYGLDRVVYLEEYVHVGQAIAREKAMKKWNRKWKLNTIEGVNPEWKDLVYESGFPHLRE